MHVPMYEDLLEVLFCHLKARLEESQEAASELRELIGQPSENWHRSEGDEAEVEIASEFVRGGRGDPAEDWIAVHLREDPDKPCAKTEHQHRKVPVERLTRLKGEGVPADDGEHESHRDEEHQVPNINQRGTDEGDIAYDEKLFR